ncbi:hypothetical protein HDU83_000991 [Entophlyctis luteolus]|nr:hypothetical protein HDU83_000991 [Entophlyctis luteolus]
MFFLLQNGEIWVAATSVNPCVVVDIWASAQSVKENVCCILALEGALQLNEDVLEKNIEWRKGYSIVIGGTKGGQIVFYSTKGQISSRVQLHFAPVIHLMQIKENQLLSAGEDNLVYISRVDPLQPHMIDPLLVINMDVIPKIISVLDSTICFTDDSFAIGMFSFNFRTGEWQRLPSHNRSDDHTDVISSICSIDLLNLFVSTSHDSTIRIWDIYNSLIRQIRLHEPLSCLTVSNKRGDLLIAIQNRIDIIKSTRFLPPGYIKTLEAMTVGVANEFAEPPIPFDEKFDFLVNYLARRRREAPVFCVDLFGSRSKILESLARINFVGSPDFSPEGAFGKSTVTCEKSHGLDEFDDPTHMSIMNKLKTVMRRRQNVIDLMKAEAEFQVQELERKHNLLHLEFEEYLKYKPFMGTLNSPSPVPLNSEAPVESLEEFIPPDPLALVAEEAPVSVRGIAQNVYGKDEIEVIEEENPVGLPAIDPKSPKSGDEILSPVTEFPCVELQVESIPDHDANTAQTNAEADELEALEGNRVHDSVVSSASPKLLLFPRRPLNIAPDGGIPNSVAGGKIKNWKVMQTWNTLVNMSLQKKGRQLGDETATMRMKEQRSVDFKAKLKKMLEDQAQREAEELRKKLEIEPSYGEFNEDEDEILSLESLPDMELRRKSVWRRSSVSAPRMLERAESFKYPPIVERALKCSWFPMNQIFHPAESEETPAFRKNKVELTAEVIYPIALDCFKRATSSPERKEIMQYLKWVLEDLGIRDTTPSVRFFLKYLQNSALAKTDDFETDVCHLMLDVCTTWGQAQPDFLATMMMLLVHDSEGIRGHVTKIFAALRAEELDCEHVTKKMKEIRDKMTVTEEKGASPSSLQSANKGSAAAISTSSDLFTQSQASIEYRNCANLLIRKILKEYLVAITSDPETLGKLDELNDLGYHIKKEQTTAQDAAAAVRQKKKEVEIDSAIGTKKKKKDVLTSTPVISELLDISEVPPLARNPVAVLQNPNLGDFITAMVFYARYNQRRIAKLAAEKRAEHERKARLQESKLRRKAHDEEVAQYLQQKNKERAEKRKERLITSGSAGAASEGTTRSMGVVRENLFTGGTHISRCHPSRETLEMPLR